MSCDYIKNKLKRDIRKVKKIITRNESYIAYYNKAISEGNTTEFTVQYRDENQKFLDGMKSELTRLETELSKTQ